jgi:hypothetical protein
LILELEDFLSEYLKLTPNYILCKERNTLRRKYKYIFFNSKYIGVKMRYKIYFCAFRAEYHHHLIHRLCAARGFPPHIPTPSCWCGLHGVMQIVSLRETQIPTKGNLAGRNGKAAGQAIVQPLFL